MSASAPGIARDLHDTLLQSFQGLMLRLQAVDDLLPQGEAKEELEQTLDRADQAITEGRDAVHDLRSSTTVTNDLAQAVRALGDELSGEGSATFEFAGGRRDTGTASDPSRRGLPHCSRGAAECFQPRPRASY